MIKKLIEYALVSLLLLCLLVFGYAKGLGECKAAEPIKVALIDTGVSLKHIRAPLCETGHYDYYLNAPAVGTHMDVHGTNMANAIAHTAGPSGYCVMVLQLYDEKLTTREAWLKKAIIRAYKYGAKVINMSLSGPNYLSAEAGAIRFAVNHGITVYAAVGNNGISVDCKHTMRYPACHAKVVGVGALVTTGGRQAWSNYGAVVKQWELAPDTSTATAVATGKHLRRLIWTQGKD